MMSDLFTLDAAAVSTARAESKRDVLAKLARICAQVYGLEDAVVLERIEEREALGSTGFGRGVAIPHARVAGLAHPVAGFLQLDAPVEFDAADGMPVNLVFMLLSPEQGGAAHLQALAAISRMMRDERMRTNLASATGREEIYGLLSNVIDRDAA
jgi:PTS system nitrogen regulatory IIA component